MIQGFPRLTATARDRSRLTGRPGSRAPVVGVGPGEDLFQREPGQAAEVPDAALLIRSSDVLLVCSRAEAFGRVTIEAMQASLPIIGSRSGATPELVRDRFNGLLYEPSNTKDLANCIEYVMEHPDEARTMGNNGRTWAAALFTRQRFASEIEACLKDLSADVS